MSPSPPIALPEIDLARCQGCGACVRACPHCVLAPGPDRRVTLAFPERCDYCGACEAACQSAAILCPFVVVLAGTTVLDVI
ncbi:MAG: 4Fe-4S binding protein [Chloroflexi bacterium]|nr:4Fe-4S binding protein [Chloroflexota bacterium]